jgi:uncharacterized protein (DUF362 family)/Pyruvate/2-oxoacid:ferredoxin oxidoreductase delta subunit
MSKVLVLDATYEDCARAVDEVFATFPLDVKGKRVMVKVNALKAGDPHTTAYVTDYRLLRAVLDRLEALEPARVIVGDSVGTESYGNSEHVFEATHLKEAAGEHYLNINTDLVLVPFERPFKRTGAVSRAILEADVYISVPKMKTHGLTVLSGSVKNNYGLLVGAQKAWYHYYSVRPEIFAEIIVEMYRLRIPDLVIMDAIVAMEGSGPSSPETRRVNKVLASDDGVALDTVQAKIIGLGVDEIPYLRLARELGLGDTDLAAIEIMGDAATIEDWHMPESTELTYSYRAGIGSGRTSIDFYRGRVSMRPTIVADDCAEGCSACTDVCPTGALKRDAEGGISVGVFDCCLCSACKEVCEAGALTLTPHEGLMSILP